MIFSLAASSLNLLCLWFECLVAWEATDEAFLEGGWEKVPFEDMKQGEQKKTKREQIEKRKRWRRKMFSKKKRKEGRETF